MSAPDAAPAQMPERQDPVFAVVGRAINQALYQVDRRRADDPRCGLTWEDLAGGYLISYLFDRGWSIVQEDYIKALAAGDGTEGAE